MLPRFPTSLATALLLVGVVVGPALAQVEGTKGERTSAPVTVGAGVDLTISSLQARAKTLDAASGKPDDSAADALRDYQAAVEQLEMAQEWRQRAEALSRLQRDGPRILETTRKEMEQWARPVPTTVGPDLGQSEVEARLAEAEATLDLLRKSLLEVDAEQTRLAERRLVLPGELAAASAAGEGGLGEIGLPALPTGSVDGALARRALELARQRADAERATALELETATLESRRELLTARRDLLRRKVDSYVARVAELQAALALRRVREAEETAAQARADQASLARVHPILGQLAEENARLAAERTGSEGLSARIDAAARSISTVEDQLQRLEERSKGMRQKVAAAGLSDAIGLLLRKEKADLPRAERARADIRARRGEIAAAQFEALSLEDLLKALPGVESDVDAILVAQADTLGADESRRIEETARGVLKTRRSYLDALIRDHNALFASLVDLDAKETRFVEVLEDYRSFLDQHVLWIPNSTPPTLRTLRASRLAAQWLADPAHYLNVATRIAATMRSSPLGTGFGVLLLLAALLYRRRLKRACADLAEGKGPTGPAALPRPLVAVLLTVLLALPGPFAVWFLGWMIKSAPLAPDDFSPALAATLAASAFPLFVGEFLRRSTAAQGLAVAFLGWPRAGAAKIRRQVVLLETVALPALALTSLLDAQPRAEWSDSLGRAAFCLGVGAIGLGLHRLVSARESAATQVLRRTDLAWLEPLLARLAWVPLGITALIVGVALVGYYYTAFVFVERLWWSGLVLLAFVVGHAATLRWLAAREEALPQETVAADVPGADEAGGATAAAEAVEEVSRVSAQTRSLLRVLLALGLFVALFTVWADVFPALRFFEKVELWSVGGTVEQTVGTGEAAHVESLPVQVPVTLANLMIALLGAVLAVVGARNLPGVLELTVLSRLGLDRGLRYAIAMVSRYTVFVVGAVVAFDNLGVGWSKVQWLVAAVSVGLGFGLQEIFGNFVSGLIILFERPVRVGDTVTIDGVTGTVRRIEMRATTILDADRKELIVPNKDLITEKLLNWSLHDPVVRLVVPVGVAYGSDTAAVQRILLEVAQQCGAVLVSPAPIVAFTSFGDSALQFELRVFLTEPDQIVETRHELHMTIERRFRAAGIEMPFPQRDVHLRSVDPSAASALGEGLAATTKPEGGGPPARETGDA